MTTNHSQSYSLPDFVLDKLLCISCNNVLSVPPIYNTPSGESVCGRCSDVKNPPGVQNVTYETLLEVLTFPCMNKEYGCLERLTGTTMWTHEISCFYRRVNCPLASTKNCDWIGDIGSILGHFEDHHAIDLMEEPSFEMNFLDNFEDINILPYSDSLFVVRRHGDREKGKFWCCVQAIQKNEMDQYNYSLTLKNPVSGDTHEFSEKKVGGLKDEDGFEMKIEDVCERLKNPVMVIASINITESDEKPCEKKSKTGSLSNVDMDMLKAIECPVCFEFMVPPIFQCEIGHSICGHCKDMIKECPTCRRPFGDAQNFAVENITSYIKYPCKNFERGCEFIATAKTIKQHESTCQFGAFRCPTSDYTSCTWTGLQQNIWDHCKAKHRDHVIECYSVSLPFDPNEEHDDEDCFILNYNRKIFVLHWKYANKIFYWSVQLVGPPEDSKNYYFDLDIIDRSGRNLRVFMRAACEALTDKYLAFQENRSYLFLNLDQIKPLINEIFSFKPSVSRYPSTNV